MHPTPTPLVITDLTRMYRGMVCIAGYNKDLTCLRPISPAYGIPEHTLFDEHGTPIIYPFAVIHLDLLDPRPEPPHTEDIFFFTPSPRFLRKARDPRHLLEQTLSPDLATLFEQPIHHDLGFYVMAGQGPRSLGTIRPDAIIRVGYEPDPRSGAWDYRLTFTDACGDIYRLKITDLTWQYYCSHQRTAHRTPADIASTLTHLLQTREVYLRLGLARGWKEYPDRCYLQITGLYTFPDYLDGKTFADFR
jgi:hypothetical protein